MNKRLLITIAITIVAYALFYFFGVKNSPPEAGMLSLFTHSLIYLTLAIPFGWIATAFARRVRTTLSGLILALFAVAWGFLFGWLTMRGLLVGHYISKKRT
ncbi:MAG: hypothetical protein V1735_00300 [Nanoarchaeota archaeon]